MNNKESQQLKVANSRIVELEQQKGKGELELADANNELSFQNEEREKCAEELLCAYRELSAYYQDKEKSVEDLIAAYKALERSSDNEKQYRKGLEEMMFMTSHQLRSPIANIIGILNHLDSISISEEEEKEMKEFLKQFARKLDHLTRDLTTFIYNEGIKISV